MAAKDLAINGGEPVRTNTLGYGHQSIDDADIAAVTEVLRSDFLTCGPAVIRFEEELKGVTDAAHMTAVANGTAALHVAALAADIKPGDEVIVSPITFAASANCILYCGATPVFADIDPKTWNIAPTEVERLVSPKTKAIVAVDFGGVPVDAEPLQAICEVHGLTFIEDAAHSLGSSYHGTPVGSLADITAFSFHPVKTITTGEGGAVATSDDALGTRVELFAKHGITRDVELLENKDGGGWYYEQLELGYNYRMSDLQAALGSSQLARLDAFAARRRDLVSFYNEAFDQIPHVAYQQDPDPSHTVRHLYCLWFDTEVLGVDRRVIYNTLRAEGIGVNVHYQPVYWLPYYQRLGYRHGLCPQAERYYEGAVTLPLHVGMSDGDAQDVVDAVTKVIEAYSA